MKITKKELVRIIEQEVNKVRFPKGPIDQKRLVPDFPKNIPSSDIATGVVELYDSVDAISTSIMEMSARIDGMERGMQEAIRRIYEALDVIIDILPDDIAADIPLELPSFYLPPNLEEEDKE